MGEVIEPSPYIKFRLILRHEISASNRVEYIEALTVEECLQKYNENFLFKSYFIMSLSPDKVTSWDPADVMLWWSRLSTEEKFFKCNNIYPLVNWYELEYAEIASLYKRSDLEGLLILQARKYKFIAPYAYLGLAPLNTLESTAEWKVTRSNVLGDLSASTLIGVPWENCENLEF